MPGQPFSLANLREVADALYGKRRRHGLLARDLNIPERVIKGWFAGRRLPDTRKLLADLCRKNGADDPAMLKLARKLESLGPPK